MAALLFYFIGQSQSHFYIKNKANKYAMSFKIVNNLMIIPVYVNGNKLNFLLDTGVANTVILNVNIKDSLKLKNVEKIKIQGLGEGEYLDALKSTNNYVQVGNSIINRNHKIYIILGKGFNLSNRLGIQIDGIIGGDLFRDFIVKVNYTSKRIKFYRPDTYKYIKCRKCETLPLTFLYNKPYLEVETHMPNNKIFKTNLLIDSGGSDALWLFENDEIKIPKKNFIDYLGQGLNGNIFGHRSRVAKLKIGSFVLKDLTVSFPDTTSLSLAMRHKKRHGSLGSTTLKRFHYIIDYRHAKITFKKNNKYFNEPFNYNMSGIEIAYNGQTLVKEKKPTSFKLGDILTSKTDNGTSIELIYNYVFSLKPTVQVMSVRLSSPADLAGVKVGDIVLEINGTPIYKLQLQQLTHMFYEKEDKEIELLVDRDGTQFLFTFKLKKIL